jgi:hypothetical protein
MAHEADPKIRESLQPGCCGQLGFFYFLYIRVNQQNKLVLQTLSEREGDLVCTSGLFVYGWYRFICYAGVWPALLRSTPMKHFNKEVRYLLYPGGVEGHRTVTSRVYFSYPLHLRVSTVSQVCHYETYEDSLYLPYSSSPTSLVL